MPASSSTSSSSQTPLPSPALPENSAESIDRTAPVELSADSFAIESPVRPKSAPQKGRDVTSDIDHILDSGIGDTEYINEAISVVQAQGPFQPGSTPMKATKRYLAYNMIGVIEVTDRATHHIVDVQFHDRSLRVGYHFTDHFRYDLASLGESGAVYACQPATTHPAHVLYKPYGTWTFRSDWTYELHGNTCILGVAAGNLSAAKSLRKVMDADVEGLGNVVIATSDGELIFLTGGGVQRACLTLPGTFVTMVAGREWVFLVTRDGSTTTDGSQNLMGRLIRFDDLCTLQRDNLPVPKNHVLKWVGITEEGMPAIYDSSGVLNVMPRFRVPLSAMWMRVLDTRRLEGGTHLGRSYWPVGVLGDTLLCLIVRGHQEHPGFPRPLIHELPIRLPFKRMDTEEGRLEEQVARETVLLDTLRHSLQDDAPSTEDLAGRELAIDKALIQLIQLACKSNRPTRAIDLVRFLRRATSLDAAMKVAKRYHHTTVQRTIMHLENDLRASDRTSTFVSPVQPLIANGESLHGKLQESCTPLLSQRSLSTPIGGPSLMRGSAQKRPACEDYVDPGAKRLAISKSAPSVTATPTTESTQPRGNPFLRKPVKKSNKAKAPQG